ncbi:MAG: hypothetical protein GY698_24255, partial [Actinomycetia bacterium]|nr:hypothetical protein [Actinomycetes bacterium]
GTEQDAKARVSRRQALIGAGAALSAPTITSLASAPAYAGTTSAGPIELDDFTTDNDGLVGALYDGSFKFGKRIGGAQVGVGPYTVIENGILTMSTHIHAFPTPLKYRPEPIDGGTIYTTIPAECTQLVIQRVSKYEGVDSHVVIQEGFGGISHVGHGAHVGTEMVFNINALPEIADPRLSFRIPFRPGPGAPPFPDHFQFVAAGPMILR